MIHGDQPDTEEHACLAWKARPRHLGQAGAENSHKHRRCSKGESKELVGPTPPCQGKPTGDRREGETKADKMGHPLAPLKAVKTGETVSQKQKQSHPGNGCCRQIPGCCKANKAGFSHIQDKYQGRPFQSQDSVYVGCTGIFAEPVPGILFF